MGLLMRSPPVDLSSESIYYLRSRRSQAAVGNARSTSLVVLVKSASMVPRSLRKIGYSNACYVGLGSSSPLRPTGGGGEREVRNVAEETPPRYCSSCRHELKPEDYLFCPNCGIPSPYR